MAGDGTGGVWLEGAGEGNFRLADFGVSCDGLRGAGGVGMERG